VNGIATLINSGRFVEVEDRFGDPVTFRKQDGVIEEHPLGASGAQIGNELEHKRLAER
jgi:hypothetical protein